MSEEENKSVNSLGQPIVDFGDGTVAVAGRNGGGLLRVSKNMADPIEAPEIDMEEIDKYPFKTDEIYNSHKWGNKIFNSHQTGVDIRNGSQKADTIDNQGQRAERINNERQKAEIIVINDIRTGDAEAQLILKMFSAKQMPKGT